MAGHSHWANIQRTKGVADAKRGRLFSKLSRYIMIAARNGGGDPDMNLRLRYAIDKARAASMPKDNIERAVKKGTGELEGVTFDELTYEGHGPAGVAILVDIATDNRNRTNGEIRKIFERGGGKMGNPGAVAWMFKRKGLFVIEPGVTTEDRLMEVALDAGADDIKSANGGFEVTCDAAQFANVQAALQKAGIATTTAELTQLADNLVEVSVEDGQKVIKLMDMLDEHDDVQNVYCNANLTPEMSA
jgi:YebC/PmpR family DNA-binding regulatory protein